MDYPTALKRWLAAVRVATGGVFVYMSTGHLVGGVAIADGFQKMVGNFAKTDPLQLYTSVMVPIVQSAPGFLGPLFVFGVLAAGLGLMVGLLTQVALVGAVWLSLNNLLMGFGAGGVHHELLAHGPGGARGDAPGHHREVREVLVRARDALAAAGRARRGLVSEGVREGPRRLQALNA